MLRDSEEIALSLSGGGIRALGFHLGTMDYLNRIGWLERVTILASVSGGSIVATGYALAKKKGFSFERFYQDLSTFVSNVNTMEEIFANLSAPKPVVASLRRDLATGWAEVFRKDYFEKYFGDPTFGIFWEEPKIHLEEVMFNAVELKTGVAFRFQHSRCDPDLKVGNSNVYLEHEYAKQLKMSDVMVSSACIPGGMEPMQFPDDYHWPDDEWDRKRVIRRPTCDRVTRYLVAKYGDERIAIVDGGIYDNQTISSVLLALTRAHKRHEHEHARLEDQEPSTRSEEYNDWIDQVIDQYERGVEHHRLGLYIISDVPVRRDPMYRPDPESCVPSRGKPGVRRLTIARVRIVGWVLSAALLLSALVNLTDFLGPPGRGLWTMIVDILTSLIPGLVALLLFLALTGMRPWIHAKLEKVIRARDRSYWSLIKDLTVGNVWDLIAVRASSLSMLVSRFFMTRIRQLEYEKVEGIRALSDKIVANEIFTLLEPPEQDVGKDLRTVVKKAANMRTKIWIDELGEDAAPILSGRNDLQVLVAAGQATILYNLLKRTTEAGSELSARLRKDWDRINREPFCFVDER